MKTFLEFLKENTTYYHGSSDAVLDPHGFRLLPPDQTGKIQERGRNKNLNRVFMTTDPKSAKIYAGRAVQRFGGNPIVVRAIPADRDVQALNTDPGTSVYHSSGAFYEPIVPPKKGKK